jgi:hypothetical protein
MNKTGFLFVGLILTFFSCQPQKGFVAKKPPETYMHSEKTAYERRISTLNVPVQIPVAEIENQLNRQMKGLLYEDNNLNDDDLAIKVWKRDSMLIDAEGNVFNIKVPLKIWVKAGKFGIYKEIEFALNANIATTLTLTPDWQLKTITQPKAYEWVSRPVFKLGFIEIPVTGIIENVLDEQIPEISKQLDKYVGEKVEVKKYVQQAWNQVQEPYLMSKEYDSWLKVTPLEVQMTPIRGKDHHARTTLGIRTYTESYFGDKPEQTLNPVLPPLKMVETMPDDFHIGISGEVSHKQATKMLSALMLEQTYQFQDGKYKITVKSLDVYGNDEKLIIAAGLQGSLNGTVYFTGIPVFNRENKMLEIRNLDYELDTKNKLLKTASWLAHGKFVKILSESFKFPLAPQIEQAKKAIQDNLTHYQLAKGIFLRGKLETLEPKDVFITPNSIIATLEATGTVDVKIEGL